MLMDLFTIFDYRAFISPQNTKHVTLFWAASITLPSLALSSGTWLHGSPLNFLITRPLFSWAWEEALSKTKDAGSCLLLVSASSWVTMVVLWQATPGTFVSVAHLSVTGSIALPYWTAMVLASGLTCSNNFIASMVPSGCPPYLIPALVFVEFFSHLMRPMALCARLSLTTMTGHIILGLVWGLSSEVIFSLASPEMLMFQENPCLNPEMEILKMVTLFTINSFLVMVEIGIGLLQAYIFFTLLLFFNTQYPRT
uniref:ATP synthase F0 subunit 6 n=1 Tax=Lottia goshimai TaxID=1824450 RepID=UPI00211410DC|nr:ATP synthase F0 subunit 6 [Lottia goshimai]UTM92223.1 ATP synthase F0 subunit 6 [Lottia peitaihoensis]